MSDDDLSKGGPVEGRDWSTRSPEAQDRRCTAHKKSGAQCKNAALRGTTVCKFHGGAAGHVRRKARQRIDDSLDRMAKQLLGMATTAESEAVRLAAIKHVLTLGGFTEKTAVEVSMAEAPPWAQMMQGMTGIARMPQHESQARRGLIEPPRELTAADPSAPIDAEITDPPAQPDGPHYAPHWVQQAQSAAADSSGGELLTMEDAAAFTADLRRRQGQPRKVRSERFK